MDEMGREAKIVALVAGIGALIGAVIVYRFDVSLIAVLLAATLGLVFLTVTRRQGLDFLGMMIAVVATAFVLTQNVIVAGAAAAIVLLVGFFGRQAIQRQPQAQEGQEQVMSGGEDEGEGGARVVTEVRGLGRGLDPQKVAALHALIDRGGTEGKLASMVLSADLASEAVRKGVNPERVAQILAEGGETVSGLQERVEGLEVPELRRGKARGLFGGRKNG